jgi:hypothetical protein
MLAVTAALALPTPTLRPGAGASSVAGPTRLIDRWPSASPFTVDGTLPGGLSFEPRLVVDADTIVGLAMTADAATLQLVVRFKDKPVRVLETMGVSDARTLVAVAVSKGQLYWLEFGPDSRGQATTYVWRASLFDPGVTLLSSAASVPAFFDSPYDLELVDGRLYWAAYLPQGRGQIRSVPVDGGPLQVRSFETLYGLTAWPWATSSAAGAPGDVDLVNLVTGEHRTARASANQFLSCTPIWCRVTTPVNNNTDATVVLQHPDGSDVVGYADQSLAPANSDVALLDRFEVVESKGNPNLATPTVTLWMHDLRDGKNILLDDNVGGLVGSRDGFLWWSTGDNEATVWHVLDLRPLT